MRIRPFTAASPAVLDTSDGGSAGPRQCLRRRRDATAEILLLLHMMRRLRPFSSSRGGWGQSPLRSEGDEIHRGTIVIVKGTTTTESTAAYGILGVWVKLNRVSLPQPTLAPITNPSPRSGSRATRSSAPSRPTRTARALPPLLPCASHQDAFVHRPMISACGAVNFSIKRGLLTYWFWKSS